MESTNSIAFRIHAVIDAADIDYPDREIEMILKRYQKFWPYEPLDYDEPVADAKTGQAATTTGYNSA